MDKEYEVVGVRMRFYMPEELDHHVAGELKDKLDGLIDAYQIRELILDFSKTVFMDSSGIGVVIGRSRKMSFLGGTVMAANLSGRAEKLFHASGLHRMITRWEGDENVRE